MWPLSGEECYVSIDIEADGPIPGTYSMLSLGAAAFDSEGNLHDTGLRARRWWSVLME